MRTPSRAHTRVRPTLRAAAAATALVASGGLAACGSATGSTEPTTSAAAAVTSGGMATGSAAVMTTSSGTVAPLGPYPADIPDAAKANTTEGAVAFVTYYMAQINIGYTAPKAGLLPPMSLPTCLSCASIERDIATVSDGGTRYDRPAVTVQQIAPDADNGLRPGVTIVDSIFRQNGARVLDAHNNVVQTIVEKDVMLVFTVSFSNSRWMVNLIQTT